MGRLLLGRRRPRAGPAPGDDTTRYNVYVRDRRAGTTEFTSLIPDALRGSHAFSFLPR